MNIHCRLHMTSIVTKVEVTQQKELDAWQSSMSACLAVPLATCDLHPAIPISSVDKTNKIWLPWQRSLRDFKNNFTLIIHSLGSTNPENLTKISPVDFEIIFWSQRTHTHMQVCTMLQTDNHASTPPLSFYRPGALPVPNQQHQRAVFGLIGIVKNK